MEDAQEPNCVTEVARIDSDLEQRGGTRAGRAVVQARGIAPAQRVQRVWQRKHDVDIGTLSSSRSRAASQLVPGLRLTLRTVAIA